MILALATQTTQIPLRLAPHLQNEEGPRTRPRAEPAEAARRRRPGAAAAAAGSGRRRRRTGQPTAASAAPQRRRPPRRCPCWERTDAAAETVAGGAGPHGQELPAGEGAGESWVLVLVGPGWGWVPRARKTEGPSLLGVEAAGWTRSIYLAAILTVSSDGIRLDHQIFIVPGSWDLIDGRWSLFLIGCRMFIPQCIWPDGPVLRCGTRRSKSRFKSCACISISSSSSSFHHLHPSPNK